MEKLPEEVKLFEEMVEFMEKIYISNQQVSIDDRKVLSVARDNVNGVQRELCDVISSSPAIDVSLIVKDYKSKVENELNDICNKVSNLTIKVNVKDYVDSIQHNDAIIDDAVMDDATAANMAYVEKWKKLNLESEDYEQTLDFMDTLKVIATKEQVSEKDLDILFHAYSVIMAVLHDLSCKIDSDLTSSVWDRVSLTINESRSKVENELNYVCNNMSDHTIKEAISQHLVGFKAGPRPKMCFPRTYIPEINTDRKRVSSQSEIQTTNKKSKLGSGDGEFWSYADFDFGFFSQMDAIFGDMEPGPLGKRIEIQHASAADDISEEDFLVDWDPEYLENGIDVQDTSSVDYSSEVDYQM